MARTPPDSLFPDYPPTPDDRFERHAVQSGFNFVAGVDEAGRGPLAGPVVAAAVILDPAMRRALAVMPVSADFALIDGRDVPPGLDCQARALVKGDARSLSIAAASIVAKVVRDRMMVRAALVYPAYGFDRHMGYGAPRHLTAIAEHGPCPLHRMTFRPMRKD